MFTNNIVKHIYKQIKLLKTFFMAFIHLIAQFAANFFLPSFLFDESQDVKEFCTASCYGFISETTLIKSLINTYLKVKVNMKVLGKLYLPYLYSISVMSHFQDHGDIQCQKVIIPISFHWTNKTNKTLWLKHMTKSTLARS